MSEDTKRLLTATQLAERLGVTAATVRDWVAKGRIKSIPPKEQVGLRS